jgi:hypothetical protein
LLVRNAEEMACFQLPETPPAEAGAAATTPTSE